MAIETTPLGFQKPDGNELLRNGDNVIAANAQKAEDRVQEDRGRLALIEAKNTAQDTAITAARTNAVADAKTYTDGQVAVDRGRLDTLDGKVWFKGYLPNGTDLNTFGETGRWAVRLADDVATIVNAPPGANPGFVELTVTQHGMKVQTWVSYGSNTGWRRTTASVVAGTLTAWGSMDVDAKAYADTQDTAKLTEAKAYADTQDAAYRVTDRALWRTEDDGHQAAAEANAKTYADAQDASKLAEAKAYADAGLALDRARLTVNEAKNTTQDGRLTSLEAVAPKVSNIALDSDGVPYYSPGSTAVHIIQDTDGTPYFIHFMSAALDTDGTPYFA